MNVIPAMFIKNSACHATLSCLGIQPLHVQNTRYIHVFLYIYIEIYVCISDWCRHASCVKHKLKPIIRHIGQKNFKVDGLYHIDATTKHHVTGRTPPASTALGQLQCSCMRVGQRGIMGHEKGGGGRAQRFISCEAIYIKHAGQLLACTSCVTPIPRPINYPSKPSWTCWCTHSIPLGDLTNAMINAPCIPPI